MAALVALSCALATAVSNSPSPWPSSQSVRQLSVEDAPSSPNVAFGASGAMTLTGLGLMVGGSYMANRQILAPEASTVVVLVSGLLLMNFGPSAGDLLNGGVARFLGRGFGRLGGLLLGSLTLALATATPAVGILLVSACSVGWLVWVGYDLYDSTNAPKRWVARNRAYAAEPQLSVSF
jgi:hypothetical protein